MQALLPLEKFTLDSFVKHVVRYKQTIAIQNAY